MGEREIIHSTAHRVIYISFELIAIKFLSNEMCAKSHSIYHAVKVGTIQRYRKKS